MKEKINDFIEELKSRGIKCGYELIIEMAAVLNANNTRVLVSELNALSGYSTRFLYNYDFPEVYNCSVNFIVSNLKKFAGVEFSVSEENNLNNPPFIIYPQNLLVYDVSGATLNACKGVFTRSVKAGKLKNFKVIRLLNTEFNRKSIYSKKALVQFAELLKKEFYTERQTVCGHTVFSGKKAIREFAEALRDPAVSFLTENRNTHSLWLGSAVYSQWSALNGTIVYLLGLHHFLERKVQDEMSKAIRHFEDALMFWKEFDRLVGRKALVPESKPIPMLNRRRAANALLKVISSYERGIEKLLFVLGSIKM